MPVWDERRSDFELRFPLLLSKIGTRQRQLFRLRRAQGHLEGRIDPRPEGPIGQEVELQQRPEVRQAPGPCGCELPVPPTVSGRPVNQFDFS